MNKKMLDINKYSLIIYLIIIICIASYIVYCIIFNIEPNKVIQAILLTIFFICLILLLKMVEEGFICPL